MRITNLRIERITKPNNEVVARFTMSTDTGQSAVDVKIDPNIPVDSEHAPSIIWAIGLRKLAAALLPPELEQAGQQLLAIEGSQGAAMGAVTTGDA